MHKRVDAAPKVPVPQFIAWLLFNQGEKQEAIAERFDVTDRTIRIWIKNVETTMASSVEWTKAVLIAKNFISKAVATYDKYLGGKGDKIGGDLEVANKIMQIFKVLDPTYFRAGDNIEKQIITAINADIVINPQEDEDFADAVPDQLRRIVGALERLSPGQVVEGSAEPEDIDD